MLAKARKERLIAGINPKKVYTATCILYETVGTNQNVQGWQGSRRPIWSPDPPDDGPDDEEEVH